MSAIDHLLRVAAEYQRAAGLETSTASWRIFGDTKKLQSIRDGNDIQVKRLEKAMRWLSANWPDGATWPDEVARPVETDAAA